MPGNLSEHPRSMARQLRNARIAKMRADGVPLETIRRAFGFQTCGGVSEAIKAHRKQSAQHASNLDAARKERP